MVREVVCSVAHARYVAKSTMFPPNHAVELVTKLAETYLRLLERGADPMEVTAEVSRLVGVNLEASRLMKIMGMVHYQK